MVETRAEGTLVTPAPLKRRFVLPVLGGAWVGAGLGFLVEGLGVQGALVLGLFLGLAAGMRLQPVR